MKRWKQPINWLLISSVLLSNLLVSCGKNSFEGMIVAVELPGIIETTFDEAKLIVVDPGDPDKPARFLSKDFHSACSPVLSNNGRYLIFSGKQKQEDPWQIWRTDLQRRFTEMVTDLPDDCTHPAYLPDGKVVFSRSGILLETKISSLFKCNMDGSGLEQLTFHPHLDYTPSVLKDGRILYTSSQQYPIEKEPVYLIIQPDGSKSDLYYMGEKGAHPLSGGTESENGDIYFIDSDPGNQGSGRLVAINQKRPLHSYKILSDGIEGAFLSVIPYKPSTCLVSYRPSLEVQYALYEFDTREQKIINKVYSSKRNIIDPIVVRPKKRPPKLPSAMNPENPTGLLMSQNINQSIIRANGTNSGDSIADHIQVIGLKGMVHDVEAEEDGSIYLKIDADTPFRIISLNKEDEIIRGPSDWIWLRPSERRGCVGCHADPELSPENRIPLAVKLPPAIISLKEKEIRKLEESAK